MNKQQVAGNILLVLSLLGAVAISLRAAAESCEDMSAPMRALAGCGALPGAMFAHPRTREAITSYAAYLATVEGMLTAKARAMDHQTGHPRYSAKVVVCFHIAQDGGVSNRVLCPKSGNPDADRFALDVVASIGPLPPPPPSAPGSVVWVYSFTDEPSPR